MTQPQQGYRAGSDPLFLAASLSIKAGQNLLDIGCGVGTASLAVLRRCSDITAEGLELQPDLVRLAQTNAHANDLEDRFKITCGDLRNLPDELRGRTFSQVMTNPPWFASGSVTPPLHYGKATGHTEGDIPLTEWLRLSLRLVAPRGRLTLIHRADRLDDILGGLAALPVGDIRIFPLWTRQGEPAKRVVISSRKDVRTPSCLLSGMVLHHDNGDYTDQAQTILRHLGKLPVWQD